MRRRWVRCRAKAEDLHPKRNAGQKKAGQKKRQPEGCLCSCLCAYANQTPTHAAVNHMAVSNALHIIGMFIPKLAFDEFLFLGLSPACWATSVARSHDPFSWERATEKNKNT